MTAPLPDNEAARLKALKEYGILDSRAEQAFDDIVRLASFITKSPISLISLIDESRQWFKAKSGLSVDETPREQAFCAHAILNPAETMIVKNAPEDPRFAANPLVTGDPHIRFYAGVPLVTPTGEALGTLCVIDREARQLTADQLEVLNALARQVVAQMELRRSITTLERSIEEQEQYVERLEVYQQKMEEVQAQLTSQSESDGLTGLGNRRAFDRRLEEEFSRAVRESVPLAVVMLDVDHFKSFNDTFGHPAGDDSLRSVADILRRSARPYDSLARYGGEEFVALLPATSREGALVVAERIRRSVQRAVWPKRPITVSVGVACVRPGISAGQLVADADEALYRSKQDGRNRVSFAEKSG